MKKETAEFFVLVHEKMKDRIHSLECSLQRVEQTDVQKKHVYEMLIKEIQYSMEDDLIKTFERLD